MHQQDAMQRALRVPLANVARAQEALRRAQPVLDAIEQQRSVAQALAGPLQAAAESQEQVRRALEGPFEAIRRNQDVINRALAAPYASLLQQQQWLVDGLAAAVETGAIQVERFEADERDDPSALWIRAFAASLRATPLTRAQLEALLTHLSLLLAIVSTSISLSDGIQDSAELMSVVSTLAAACALLLWYSRR
jgi:hypothetical protein